MNIQRYFDILELDPDVSPEEAAQTYRDLASVWHPDRFPNNSRLRQKAEEKLKEINDAYGRVQNFLLSQSRTEALKYESHRQIGPYNAPRSMPILEKESKDTALISSQIHPWVRFLARGIDYLIFGLFLGFINGYDILFRLGVSISLFPILLTFAWIFVEAGLLTVWGTTPGKWLLKTSLVDRSLQKPPYLNSLGRSLLVWCNGMGTGILFISPVTMVIAYQKLKKYGYAPWDHQGRFCLLHGRARPSRFLTVLSLLLIFSVLNTYLIHNQMTPILENMHAHKEKKGQQRRTRPTAGDMSTPDRPPQATQDSGEAHYRLGKAYDALGRNREAISAYKQAIHIKPQFAEAQYRLGVSYAKLRLNRLAIRELGEAIRIKPDFAEAYLILGLVYLSAGDKDTALEQYQILKNLDKDLAEELLAYIESFEKMGQD